MKISDKGLKKHKEKPRKSIIQEWRKEAEIEDLEGILEAVFGLCKPPYEENCLGCISARYVETIKKLCK